MTVMGVYISLTVVWLIAAIVFGIIEGLTMGLTTIWFAGGSLMAMIVALVNGGIPLQLAAFIVGSIVLLVFTRPIFVRRLGTGVEKTNVDALIGKEAIVVKEIKPFQPGVVRIGGQDWTGVGESDDTFIPAEEHVVVKGIEGVKAIVSPLNNK